VALDFPAAPSPGQGFAAGNIAWVWDGNKWAAATAGSGSLAISASTVLPAGTTGLVLVDTTSGTLTVTLPPAPALGQTLTIKDANGFAGSGNPLTVAGGGFTIEGALNLVIAANYGWVQLAFAGTAWVQV
jgi:hypothetical protein